MEGDFALNPLFHKTGVTRVLMQQGRVLLPSDWNEQVAVSTRQMRELARDLFGPHAGPQGGAGFAITPDPAKKDQLRIGKGRYWVDGILVENDEERLVTQQPFFATDDFEVEGALIYLDVRELHVSAVQDPSIREIALGGPDTTSRAIVVWQVRSLPMEAVPPAPSHASAIKLLGVELERKIPKLIAEAKHDRDDEACTISPDSRYSGPENQLYRVEIHSAAKDGRPARFKWSRDNGSIVFPVSKIAGRSATLMTLGRDRRSSLAAGDFVEAGNDRTRFNDDAKPLTTVKKVDSSSMDVDRDGDPGVTTDPKDTLHAFLRRWDAPLLDVPTNGVPVRLEKGIEVTFTVGDADYRPGDYWLIPARTISGDVIWPHLPDGKPQPVEPHGPVHSYAPLAHRAVDGSLTDLRLEIKTDVFVRPI